MLRGAHLWICGAGGSDRMGERALSLCGTGAADPSTPACASVQDDRIETVMRRAAGLPAAAMTACISTAA